MSSLETALREFVACLTTLRARFAVVGGLAVSARTEPRFTRDADVCVAVESDAEAEGLIRELGLAGYDVRALVEQEAVDRIAAVRLVSRSPEAEGVVLDVLFASSGIEREIVETADVVDLFEGLALPLATVPALLAQKILARDDVERPQDQLDIRKLLGVASEDDRLVTALEDRHLGQGRLLVGAQEVPRPVQRAAQGRLAIAPSAAGGQQLEALAHALE